MTLRLQDKWVWDFWFAQDGSDYHMFYLQADRALQNPDLRHWHVSIGHAVSDNLRDWEILPDVIAPAQGPAWDDYTTWTGSVIQHAGLWHLFYTGSTQAEKGLVQRVGLATSPDLITWTKYSTSPLIEADPRWYEQLDLQAWHDQAWRDPWVFQHPDTGDFHAFITGRCADGPADERGVIAHARSSDLLTWEVLPPVTTPGEFGQMEVPQLVHIESRYYLLFCTSVGTTAASRAQRLNGQTVTGTHYLVADNPLGPFHYTTDTFLSGDHLGSLYSGKLIQLPDQSWGFMAFRNNDDHNEFVGEIIDPLPVTVDEAGNLVIQK